MKEIIYIGDNPIGYKETIGGKVTFLDADDNIIVNNISNLEIFDDDYFIKNHKGKLLKGKGILKLYKDETENIYSLDENKILFENGYRYINTSKLIYNKIIYNFIVLDNNHKYCLLDINGNIISKGYDDISLGESFFNNILRVSLNDEFNFINTEGEELSDIWFDECEEFTSSEFTKVMKGESINYLSKKGKLLSNIWFDKLIHLNEGYAIIEVDGKELIVGDYGKLEYEKNILDNKYFQSEKIYSDYENDKEFIAFFVYLDYYMSNSYNGPHDGMRDYILGFNDTGKALSNLLFILNNYESYRNIYSFINGKDFENKYHDKLVGRREALLSSAIYYLIESSEELKNRYNSKKYYNLCLVYMDSFFKDLLQYYKDKGYGKSWNDKFERGQESYILGEMMYDVVYWENIYLSYGEGEWTPFCTGGYLECLKK